MSTIVLQIGQGGNQYGFAFFNALGSSLPSEFFEEKMQRQKLQHIARALLIDMEPKVVASIAKKANATGVWKYGPQRFTLESGSGNNWAAGYCSSGTTLLEPILQQIRRKVEACDDFGGFLAIQSLAGGTGAGFGSYLLQVLKDEYPSTCIMSHCIWPYESGEVVVQNYNVLLTLAKLQEVADGVITIQNETLAAICKRSLGIPKPSFNDMNRVGAHSLASILLPSYWRLQNSVKRLPSTSQPELKVKVLLDLVNAVCAHPDFRMLSLYSSPPVRPESIDFNTYTWASQLKQLRRSVYPVELNEVPEKAGVLQRSMQRSIASMLVLRGEDARRADVSIFSDPNMYARWSIDPLNVAAHEQVGLPERSEQLVAGMLTNCQAAIFPAATVLSRAYAMYSSKAYLHQYFQHGLDKDFFDTAFATVENLLARYSTL